VVGGALQSSSPLLGGGVWLAKHRRLVDDHVRGVVWINANRDLCSRLQATDDEAPDRLSRLRPVALALGKLDVELHRDGRPLIDVGATLAEAYDGCVAGEPGRLDIGILGPEYPAKKSHRPTVASGRSAGRTPEHDLGVDRRCRSSREAVA
jgi:hypothetical protein